MRHYLLFCLLLCYTTVYSQQFTAKIIDKNTNEGIPFATIQLDGDSGVISNEEGVFTLQIDNDDTALKFSCMGYESQTIDVKSIKANANIVVLNEAINELSTVYLSKNKPSVESIINNVNNNIDSNYSYHNTKHNIFFRTKTNLGIKKLDFSVKKATGFKKSMLTDANASLDSLSKVIIDANSEYYRDFLGDLYVSDTDSTKLDVVQATMLLDKKQSFSLEDLQDKTEAVIFKYLNKDQTYKLKSGLFKIQDSLSFDMMKRKENKDKNTLNTAFIRFAANVPLKKTNTEDKGFLRTIINPKKYDYTLEDITFFNDQLIYVLRFEPRRGSAKYRGKLYISDDDYAITKVDYTYNQGKTGSKLNLKFLLGIKFVENVNKGTIIFEKQDDIYRPKYINEQVGRYVYVHRPLKFVENGEERNRVRFDFLIEGNMLEKTEVLFKNSESLSNTKFNTFTEKEKTKFINLKRYNSEIWKQYNVLEPLNEMKNFTAE